MASSCIEHSEVRMKGIGKMGCKGEATYSLRERVLYGA